MGGAGDHSIAGQSGGGNLIESLLGILLSEKVGDLVGVAPTSPKDPAAQSLKDEMMRKMARKDPGV